MTVAQFYEEVDRLMVAHKGCWVWVTRNEDTGRATVVVHTEQGNLTHHFEVEETSHVD